MTLQKSIQGTSWILFTVLIFFFSSHSGFSQAFVAGVPSFDSTGYVEYIPGNLPVVISVPHGGYTEPAAIPDRDCNNCIKVRDSYTQELARDIGQVFYEKTGCYPHIVINLLHRKKFDANRAIGDAADGHPTVEQAWHAYHELLDSAKAQIEEDYGRGLFLDLHGHAHMIQRIELGYLLSRSELQLSNGDLNASEYIEQSSIQSLVENNLQSLTHAELLRGDHSFGSLLESKGIPAVPSANDPFPVGSESYFSGGYNTVRHGALNGGNIDGIQIECNQDIRFDTVLRERLADSLTQAINEFIDIHYNDQYQANYCGLITNVSENFIDQGIEIFPNPTQGLLNVRSKLEQLDVAIYNLLGQKVSTDRWQGEPLAIHFLQTGYYAVEFRQDGLLVGSRILIKH